MIDVVDITPAIDAGNLPYLRRAFQTLVEYPHRGEIRCGGPGHLIVALDRVTAALKDDREAGFGMPWQTCAELGLSARSTYADGAAAALDQRSRLVVTFTKCFVRDTAGAF